MGMSRLTAQLIARRENCGLLRTYAELTAHSKDRACRAHLPEERTFVTFSGVIVEHRHARYLDPGSATRFPDHGPVLAR
jgi:hypothetical protein